MSLTNTSHCPIVCLYGLIEQQGQPKRNTQTTRITKHNNVRYQTPYIMAYPLGDLSYFGRYKFVITIDLYLMSCSWLGKRTCKNISHSCFCISCLIILFVMTVQCLRFSCVFFDPHLLPLVQDFQWTAIMYDF